MNIKLNGEVYELAGQISVSQLIDKLQLDERKIAIERNLEVIPKSTYQNALINEGDELEIIQFIGGG